MSLFYKNNRKGSEIHGKVDFWQNQIVEKVWKLLKTSWKKTYYTSFPSEFCLRCIIGFFPTSFQ
jgi:hypothetical protein